MNTENGSRKSISALLLLLVLFAFAGTSCGDNTAGIPRKDAEIKHSSRSSMAESARIRRQDPVDMIDPDFASVQFGSTDWKEISEEKPCVEVRRDHIVVRESSGKGAESSSEKTSGRRNLWNPRTPVPGNALICKLTPRNPPEILWKPYFLSGTVSGIRLPDAVLSPDQSVIVFVETTGKAEGPFGSRLVLMNTHLWKIANILEIPGRRIEKIAFIPGTTRIAALCRKQKILEQPCGVAVFDLVSGAETGFRHVPEGAGNTTFLASADGSLFLSHPEEPFLIVLSSANFVGVKMRQIPAGTANAAAALSPDGRRLATAGPETMEIRKTSDLGKLASFPLPENLPRTVQFFSLSDSDRDFLFYGSSPFGTNPVLATAGRIRVLDRITTSGPADVSKDGHRAFFVRQDGRSIVEIDTGNGEIIRITDSQRAVPHINGGAGRIMRLFRLDGINALGILDTTGNFYLLHQKEKNKNDSRFLIFTNSRT